MNTHVLESPQPKPASQIGSADVGSATSTLNSDIAGAVPPADHPTAPLSPVPDAPPATDSPQPPKFDIGVLGAVEELSPEEYMALLTNEEIIRGEFKNSLDVGLALADIRNQRLYRIEDVSFPDYYRRKWHFDTNKVHYLTATAEVYRVITAGTDLPKPDNAFQLRPLLNLPIAHAKLAWEHAAKMAAGGKIAARLVRAAVAELKFNAEEDSKRAEIRRVRAQRRQELTQTMAELLESILTRQPYEHLAPKAALLDQQVRFFFPKGKN